MIPLTTPTHRFDLPFDAERLRSARIIYTQNGTIKLTKELSDCRIEGRSLIIELSQEETNLFRNGGNVSIQLHVLTIDDKALVSQVITVSRGVCLDSEVITA